MCSGSWSGVRWPPALMLGFLLEEVQCPAKLRSVQVTVTCALSFRTQLQLCGSPCASVGPIGQSLMPPAVGRVIMGGACADRGCLP